MGMYGKIGRMDGAHEVFDRMAIRSCVSWNTMILGVMHLIMIVMVLQKCFK